MGKTLFGGSRTDCVSVVSGSLSESNEYIDGTYSDAGVNVQGGVARVQAYDPASAPVLVPYAVEAGHSFYYHAFVGSDGDPFGDNGPAIQFQDSAGAPWLQLLYLGQWQYNAGTATAVNWQNFAVNTYGPMVGHGQSAGPIDVKITIDAGGNHTLFMAANSNTAVVPTVFAQPLMTNLSSVLEFPSRAGYNAVFSQMILTEDSSTVGGHVGTSRATGVGSNSGWIGTYTDVNEQYTNTSNYNQALTDNLSQSYPMGNITVPQGCVIASVFCFILVKNDGSDPANVANLLITGAGVDHVSGDLNGMLIAFAGLGAMYPLNPDTGIAWTQTDWNHPVESGYVSKP